MGVRICVVGLESGMWKRRLVVVNAAGVTGVCLLSVLGLANGLWWPFVFADQPRVHYALALLVGLVVGLSVGRAGLRFCVAGLAGVGLLVNAWLIWPAAGLSGAEDAGGDVLWVMHCNVGRAGVMDDRLLGYVEEVGPDVLFLQEATVGLLADAGARLISYELVIGEARTDTRGVAAFVRRGVEGLLVESADVVRFAEAVTDRPIVEVGLAWGGGRVWLASYHCKRPGDGESVAIQRGEYEGLAGWFGDRGDAAAAMGDFNATPWSGMVRGLIEGAGLGWDQGGLIVRPTWPAGLLVWAGVPIDLCVVNGGVRVVDVRVGGDVGSDHLPVVWGLVVRGGDGE